MKKIKKIFCKRFFIAFWGMNKCVLAFLYVKIFKIKKDSWIICERKNEARDNGYHLFNYIVKNEKEQKVFYIISRDSYDRQKIKDISKNIIDFGSLKHWVHFFSSSALISTHINGYVPNELVYKYFAKRFNIPGKRIFLQHGIIKDNLPQLYYEKTKLDLFICGANPEFEYVNQFFHYPKGIVNYTGLCRYDNLLDYTVKKQILVMPTFRMDLYVEPDDILTKDKIKIFNDSDFYKNYIRLLNDKNLNKFLHSRNIELFFYPHHEMQKYIPYLKLEKLSNITVLTPKESDIQQLLKDSLLLITDYSSVFFDFAYMLKSTLYFQFDYKQYRDNHYEQGYFDYEKNGFGDVVYTYELLIKSIKRTVNNNFELPKKYYDRINHFFTYRDKNNCKRNYNAIRRIAK